MAALVFRRTVKGCAVEIASSPAQLRPLTAAERKRHADLIVELVTEFDREPGLRSVAVALPNAAGCFLAGSIRPVEA